MSQEEDVIITPKDVADFDNFESSVIAPDTQALMVAVDGFEGPLDLLLSLARNQKVDLAKISIQTLAEQYLEFIESTKRLNLELAADYLVMAAWLAYLKSRLILPQEKVPEGEPSADEMATRLRWRLQRLDAMRAAATRLMGRERLGRDVFGRGAPEPVNVIRLRTYKDSLYDLLTAYATERVRKVRGGVYRPVQPMVLQIEEARERLERMLGRIADWSALTRLLPLEWSGAGRRRSAMASTLLACLEMARDGRIELQQAEAFAEIFVRDRAGERPEPVSAPGT
jgi:segregation and condensation protein A